MSDYVKYVSRDERRTISRVLSYAHQQGWSVSVNDGEELVAVKIRPMAAKRYLGSTDEDTLIFFDKAENKVGAMWLVYGNAGEEVVADMSANDAMEACWNYAMEIWETV